MLTLGVNSITYFNVFIVCPETCPLFSTCAELPTSLMYVCQLQESSYTISTAKVNVTW